MRLPLILILIISLPGYSVAQKDEIENFFSQFENGFYKDLTKEKFLIVDSITDVSHLNFKEINADDTLLTTEDIEFICDRLKSKTTRVWTNKIFANAKIESKKKLLSIVGKTTTKITSIAYFELSLPYFNRSKDVCLFEYNFYCGRLCFESSLRLYKKINGQWVLINKYWYIVS